MHNEIIISRIQDKRKSASAQDTTISNKGTWYSWDKCFLYFSTSIY